MGERGIGLSDNEAFTEFLSMMRRRHGIEEASCSQTLLIGSDCPDDANIFMLATGVELHEPAVRMRVEENAMGMPTLSIMLQKGLKNPQRLLVNGFDGKGVLMLENIDEWAVPDLTGPDDKPFPFYFQLTSGAMQAVSFIRQAVEDPRVQVLASTSSGRDLEPFFADLLFPLDYFDLAAPTREERGALWNHACSMHPSLRMLDREELVRCTEGLSRTEVFAVARQAVEQAWHEGIRQHRYVPVTRENLFDKALSFLPMDSPQYAEVSEALVKSLDEEFSSLEEQVEQWRREGLGE